MVAFISSKVWFLFIALTVVMVVGSPTTNLMESVDCLLRDCERYFTNADRNNDQFTGKNNRFPFLDILGYSTNFIYHFSQFCVPPIDKINGTPFTYLAYNFVSVLTAGNPHCHKIGISHNYRTLSRQVRGWTSGRSLPV